MRNQTLVGLLLTGLVSGDIQAEDKSSFENTIPQSCASLRENHPYHRIKTAHFNPKKDGVIIDEDEFFDDLGQTVECLKDLYGDISLLDDFPYYSIESYSFYKVVMVNCDIELLKIYRHIDNKNFIIHRERNGLGGLPMVCYSFSYTLQENPPQE